MSKIDIRQGHVLTVLAEMPADSIELAQRRVAQSGIAFAEEPAC
jgi:hypothetical protein